MILILVNTGSYKADGETYGIYLGLNTSALTISAGAGAGDIDIDTTRIDLGTGNTYHWYYNWRYRIFTSLQVQRFKEETSQLCKIRL